MSHEKTFDRRNSSVPLSQDLSPCGSGLEPNRSHKPKTFVLDEFHYCHGHRRFFELCEKSGRLVCYRVKNRVTQVRSPVVAYMENNCYMNSPRASEGTFIAFRLPNDEPELYRLGVIQRLIFSMESRDSGFPGQCDGVLAVEEWLGGFGIDEDGTRYPDFFDITETSCDHESQFKLRVIEFNKQDSTDIVPINQYSGRTPLPPCCWKKSDLTNPYDGDLQASSKGADIFPKRFHKRKVSIDQRHSPPQDYADHTWVPWEPLLKENIIRGDPDLRAEYTDYYARAKDNELLQAWNTMPRKSVDPNAQCLCVTVTTGSGDPLTAEKLSTLNTDVKGKKMVPSITDCINENQILRFHCFDRKQYQLVDREWRNEGISEKFAQSLLDEHCNFVFSTIVPNKCKLFRGNNRGSFVKTFAGRTNVPTHNCPDKLVLRLLEADLAFQVVFSEHWIIKDLVPLSTVVCEAGIHSLVLKTRHVDLAIFATGQRGNSHDRRSLQPVGGGLNYMGNRMSGTQSQPSPTEGPGVAHLYQLWNNQSHDPRFLYPYVALCKFLSNNLFWKCLPLFQAGMRAVTCASPRMLAGFCELMIFSFNNFNCASHIDRNDNVDGEHAENIMEIATFLRDCERSVPDKHASITKLCEFFEEMGISIPTSCGYQFPRPHGAPRVFVWQFFVMESIRVAIAIRDFTTHIFQGGLVQHNTAVPVYHAKNRVWIGRPPAYLNPKTNKEEDTVKGVGWGSGRKNQEAKKDVQLAVRGIVEDGSNWVHDTENCGKVGVPCPTSLEPGMGPHWARPTNYIGKPGMRVTTNGVCESNECLHRSGELCGDPLYNSEDDTNRPMGDDEWGRVCSMNQLFRDIVT